MIKNNIDCTFCDPQCFVVYGYCPVCKRMCEPPLIDYRSVSALDGAELIKNWNKKKEDPNHPLFPVIDL